MNTPGASDELASAMLGHWPSGMDVCVSFFFFFIKRIAVITGRGNNATPCGGRNRTQSRGTTELSCFKLVNALFGEAAWFSHREA